jgi:haloacetate dehalogenase
MWGASFGLGDKWFDVDAVWKTMGNDVTAIPIPECDYLCQEESPEIVNAELLKCMSEWQG